MNSVCTRCSLRLQRAAHTELRSTSTRAFSSAPVQRRGKCYTREETNIMLCINISKVSQPSTKHPPPNSTLLSHLSAPNISFPATWTRTNGT